MKQKFSLTSDLVRIEPEPKEVNLIFSDPSELEYTHSTTKQSNKGAPKELINFRIDIELKRNFQKWCFEEGRNMSEVISDMIRSKIKKLKIK